MSKNSLAINTGIYLHTSYLIMTMSYQQVSDGNVDLSICALMGRIRWDNELEVLNADLISRCSERHSQPLFFLHCPAH